MLNNSVLLSYADENERSIQMDIDEKTAALLAPQDPHLFADDKEKQDFLLCFAKTIASRKKTLLYKGILTRQPVPCTVLGYDMLKKAEDSKGSKNKRSDFEGMLIIQVQGFNVCIHPQHLVEMQKSDYVPDIKCNLKTDI
jgi:hypothetical protein